jgi:predicted ATPase/signal transduction histidine kinase/DNA-binding NarL/FixJ family response regulator
MQEMQYQLKGYQILEKLYDGPQTLVYRGQRNADRQSVIVKFIKNPYPTLSELAQFRHQYAILQRLDIPGVIKAYSLEQSQKRLALILEDYGGISLHEFITTQDSQESLKAHSFAHGQIAQYISLQTFFSIALQLVQILDDLHRQKVTHKDIKPENILIHPTTLEVKLIDFSIASRLTRENQSVQNPDLLEGTLAYMSPEQTGRLNRGVDYRTDFYSLGITFYKLLTGQLPFKAVNSLALIHEHIAGIPTPPNQLNFELPVALNQIVLKLMAKMPEERYQTAYGLKIDLIRCQSLWLEHKKTIFFELGTQDISDRFTISEKLYGREQEIETLISAFDQVAEGSTKIIFVSGPSGMGKTTLVQEVHKPIARRGGYFISGKFEQLQNSSPLSGLVQAFRHLVQQLLTESKQEVEEWQTKILEALGGNSQILIKVLPELELLIGKQPPAEELEPLAAQNRFNFLFQRFIQIFPSKNRPLVLFIDDLQWADFASLQLLQSLATQTATPYLLIIGTYRSEEVSSAHPLQLTIDEIKKSGVNSDTLLVGSLSFNDLNFLIVDTLNCKRIATDLLTQTIYTTSQGNPFFSIQLLKHFYQEGLIYFDWGEHCWQWDCFEIQATSQSVDIVKFLASQIQNLSPITQEFLKTASCKGGVFSDKFLAQIFSISLVNVRTSLWEALQAGLIVSSSQSYRINQENISYPEDLSTSNPSQDNENECQYNFAHDRIQQASYSLISEDQRKQIHSKIGYHYLNAYFPIEKEVKIFEIVNQLNLGVDYIQDFSERKQLSQLNWSAGDKARTSNAYAEAARYYTAGLQLLNFDSWQTEYELTLGLHNGAAEAALLMADYERLEFIIKTIELNAKRYIDRFKAYQVRIEAYKAQGNAVLVIDSGLEALNIFGLQLSKYPEMKDVQVAFCETQLFLDNIDLESLENLPLMEDQEKLIIMDILGRLLPITFYYNPLLFSILIFNLVNLSIKYGNSPISALAYISFGVSTWIQSKDLTSTCCLGELGIRVANKFDSKENFVKANFAFNFFIRYWSEHLKDTGNYLLKNYTLSLEAGDLVHASFSLVESIGDSLLCGKSLSLLKDEITQYHESMVNLNQEIPLHFYGIYWQTIVNLVGNTQNPKLLRGDFFDESLMLTHFQHHENRNATFLLHFYKLFLCYLFRDYSKTLENIKLAEDYLDSVSCTVVSIVFSFYRLLGLLAVYSEKNATEQVYILETVTQQSVDLKKWAESAPMNFLHKYYLVEAEQHRVLGQHIEAMSAYDRAISLAQENEYLNEEALAYELAGMFYLGWGKNTIAQTYLINAYYAYERWGANAKLRDLEKRYPGLLELFQKSESNPSHNALRTISEETHLSSRTNNLDWLAVMRASQALSQEIDLDKLLSTIMDVVIESAGAEKASLLLLEEEGLVLKAHCTPEDCCIEESKLFCTQPHWSQRLPMSVINYVERTGQPLVLDNAVTETRFAADPYVVEKQPLSVLCMPIQRQGKLIGTLYLENNLTTNAFTTDRLEVLQFLTAQAAISLENAQLYASVEQKVKDRTLELQIAKQEAERAKEASEKANRAKSEFLANMSHELRTPLNAVLGFSELLHRDPSTLPEQRKKLGIINRSGEHLLTLINDVLTMSKIEAGRTTLHETSFELEALISSIHEMLSMKAISKNLTFEVEYSQGMPRFIHADEGKLRQVLINLLGNSIKFTQQGSVKLRVSQTDAEKNMVKICPSGQTAASLTFEVEDTGPGIAPHELKDLFEAFAQTETGRQSQEGTGLGLPISRTFVQLMGGDIRVKSMLGQGSCFSFDIQVCCLQKIPTSSKTLGNVIGLASGQLAYRILVVEDRWENQQVLVDLLESVGFEVQVASNGKEAIALWQTNPPHLILMDLQMPVMDGKEATLAIQQQAAQLQQKPPFIVAITANTFEETCPETLEVGFDDFVHKPFQAEALLETIAKHLGVQYLREGNLQNLGIELQIDPDIISDSAISRDLQQLPQKWIKQVYLAASELDESKLKGLIEEINAEYPAIANTLLNLLNNFRFDKIVNLVQLNPINQSITSS